MSAGTNAAVAEAIEDKEAAVSETVTAANDQGGGEPTAEERAYAMGWRPQDEYKGSAKWIDAEAFLAKADAQLPMLRENNRKMQAELVSMHRKLDESTKVMKDLVAMQAKDRERAVKAAVEQLKTERRAAVEAGDVARVEAYDTRIDEVREAGKDAKATASEQAKPSVGDVPQVYKDWANDNRWFMDPRNPDMRALAEGTLNKVNSDPDTQYLDDAEKLEIVTAEVKKRFPERFGNRKRAEAPAVEGNSQSARRSGGSKSFADLPEDAKNMCDRLIKQGAVKSRDAYAKSYFE